MKSILKQTVCARDCYDSCPLTFELDNKGNPQKIIRAYGHDAVPHGGCARSNSDIKRLNTNRIQSPQYHKKNINWHEALTILSSKIKDTIKDYGAESILFLNYGGNQSLLAELFPERIWRKIGATLTDGAICTKSGHDAVKAHYGNSRGLQTFDVDKNLLVFWGMNPIVTSPNLWRKIMKERKKRDLPLIVIDPAKSETAKRADLFLQIHPGTDTALAFGIMNILMQNNRHDIDFLNRFSLDFDTLYIYAQKFDIKSTSRITGISISNIQKLADLYDKHRPSATFIGVGLQKTTHGYDQVRTLTFIPTILGQHRGFFYSNGQASPINKSYLTGEATYGKTKETSQITLPQDIKNGKFKLIFVSTMNPAATMPNLNTLRKGLQRKDVFLAVHDTHHTETTALADLILPATTYLEKFDVTPSWAHNYIRFSEAVCKPVTAGKTEPELVQALAKYLNLEDDFLFEDPKDALNIALREAVFGRNITEIKEPIRMKLEKPEVYPTKSGKIEFLSDKAKEAGFGAFPQYHINKKNENQFHLISGASPKYTNSQFEECHGKRNSNIFINPKDAKRLNIDNEQIIEISNNLGKIKLKAKISDKTASGVLFTYRLARGTEDGSVNDLIASETQKTGTGPVYNSCIVNIIP